MKSIKYTAAVIGFILLLATPAMAQDSMHKTHPQTQEEQMGKVIREAMVDGHHLTYRLIDMKERMKGMDMLEMSATHHLMLYIHHPEKGQVSGATVGYLVEGPNEADQKVMAMGMGEGYGADVYMGDPGAYTIKTKAVFDGEKLIDGFTHEMK